MENHRRNKLRIYELSVSTHFRIEKMTPTRTCTEKIDTLSPKTNCLNNANKNNRVEHTQLHRIIIVVEQRKPHAVISNEINRELAVHEIFNYAAFS